MSLRARNAVISAIVLALGLSPVPALAASSTELQAELDQVEEELHSLYGIAEQANNDLVSVTNDLNETNERIDQLEDEIEDQKSQLSAVQEQLAGIVAVQYKEGDFNLLTLLLNSADFDELIANVRYASSVTDQKQEIIDQIKALTASLESSRSSLEEQKAQQEQLVTDQQAKLDDANAAAAEAQEYYDQLSEEVKQALAAEEEAARKAAEEEARQAAEEAQSRADEETESSSSESSGQSQGGTGSSSTGGSGSSGSGSSSNGSGSSGGGSSTSTGSVNAMVARAYSIVGSGYQWSGYYWSGSPSTSAFTCSGVVDYALGLPSNSNSPETLYAKVVARGTYTTDASSLQYGDLVFYQYGGRSPGHVGIYVGNGCVIDSVPGGGVNVRSMYYVSGFMGGGSIL